MIKINSCRQHRLRDILILSIGHQQATENGLVGFIFTNSKARKLNFLNKRICYLLYYCITIDFSVCICFIL